MRARRGFTLIELLVVVSIIALLIAFLLPVLGSSREATRLSVCMSNMRQLAEAWHAYSVNNDGYLPVSDNHFADQSWVYWATSGVSETVEDLQAGTLWDYVRDAEVYRCPSEDRVASDGRDYIRSYSISAFLNSPAYKGRAIGQTQATTIEAIHRPSETILMLDEADPRNRVRGAFQFYSRGIPGREWQWIDWPAHFHFEGFPHSLADGSVVFRRYEDPRSEQIKNFWETHVDSIDWAYFADHFDPGEPSNP